ncbi:MAG: 16S rRNA (uracil(1498)-N(3))-methyltransferase [Gammaproteobacteria bacterium]
MRITRIYYSGNLSAGTTLRLDKSASHHLVRVLRMKPGASIIVFNNTAYEYECELLDDNQSATSIRVNAQQECHTESCLRIHLLQGVSRGDRMDISIQKATELGVDMITPVICNRTNISFDVQRSKKKREHWQQVIISACEQSGRSQLAKLPAITAFEQALQASPQQLKLVLDPTASTSLRSLQPDNTIALLIGPEGGLTESEIEQAKQAGFIGVSLGPRVLRTETAGIAAISALQVLWGDAG